MKKHIVKILIVIILIVSISGIGSNAAVQKISSIDVTPSSGDKLIRGQSATITWKTESKDVEYEVQVKYYDEKQKLKKSETIDEDIDEKTTELEEIADEDEYEYLRIYIKVYDDDDSQTKYSDYYKLYTEAEAKREAQEADDESAGKADGEKMGKIDAIAQGKMDFYEGKSNNYSRSMLDQNQLMKKYRLDREVEKYRIGFFDAYYKVYMDEYKKAYRAGFSDELYEYTYDEGESIQFTQVTMDGATLRSSDGVVNMVFEEGSVYLQNNLKIEKINDKIPAAELKDRFIQVSNIYNVVLKNEDEYMNVYKPIKMTFKYIGPENVGVYKKVNGTWVYYDSNVFGNSIECTIDEKRYNGGNYVVLIDKKDRGLIDIEDHWAKDEIEIIAKRDWIIGYEDGTFKPKQEITRAEFAVMMYNVFGWYNMAIPSDPELHFTDAHLLGEWGKKAIYAAVVNGIITGYPDGSFKPNNKITYQEIEWLAQRMYKDRGYVSFTWEDMAQVMMDEKGILSRGLTNKANAITRDEVAYMFYILNRGW